MAFRGILRCERQGIVVVVGRASDFCGRSEREGLLGELTVSPQMRVVCSAVRSF